MSDQWVYYVGPVLGGVIVVCLIGCRIYRRCVPYRPIGYQANPQINYGPAYPQHVQQPYGQAYPQHVQQPYGQAYPQHVQQPYGQPLPYYGAPPVPGNNVNPGGPIYMNR